jgi:hypothetical protein
MVKESFIEFEVNNLNRFEMLRKVFTELKHDKELQLLSASDDEAAKNPFRESSEWMVFFDDVALSNFWWPTDKEYADWLASWFATPVASRLSNPSLKRPPLFSAMIDGLKNGEYELIACELLPNGRGRITFLPLAFPYGGTTPLKTLIEAFGCKITREENT